MSINQRLTDDLKQAMRGGDTLRRDVIRLALAAIKNAELVKNGPLTPDEVAAALKAAKLSLTRDQINPTLEASWARRRGEPTPPGLDERAIEALARAGQAKAATSGPLTDAEIEEILQRQAKQRRDSIDAYRAGSRNDLAAKEEAELAILLDYLPQPLGSDELRTLVHEVIAQVGASGPRDMGKVMPAVMARVGQRADGKTISTLVRELLS